MKSTWNLETWYCPNCGAKVGGHPATRESVHAQCSRCKTSMVIKRKHGKRGTLQFFPGEAV